MTISNLLRGGVSIGIKNYLSLVGAYILYALTIWIPYLNIGTTIAIMTLPATMSRGEVISPKEIFDPKYRKNMGNFFLLYVLFTLGIASACFFCYFAEPIAMFLRDEVFNIRWREWEREWEPFMFVLYIILCIPGIVQCFAWSQAPLLLVDKGLDPIQALNESNLRTYGHKWKIFFSFLVCWISAAVLFTLASETLMQLERGFLPYYYFLLIQSSLYLFFILFFIPIYLGVLAEIYRQLGIDKPSEVNKA